MPMPPDNKMVKANFRKAKVLVIEDDDDHWTLVESAMQRCLPEVKLVRAATPGQALEYLGQWTTEEWEMPKLILLDLYLPGRVEGWQLLQQIRNMITPFNQIPVVMLSSSNAPTDIVEAYQRGSSSYLVKPTSMEEWIHYFQQLRAYWWETVALPPLNIAL